MRMPKKPARKSSAVGVPREELEGDPTNYQAGRGRRVQVTGRGRERFDKGKRKVFLEWFAATCNAKLAAAKAGVNYRTPYRARMNDAAFAEAWDLALEQGYARIEAGLLEMQFRDAVGEPDGFDGAFEASVGVENPSTALSAVPLPRESGGGEVLSDPTMAMQLLRQHRPEVMRLRRDRAAPGSLPRGMASDAEVRRALAQALRAFGVRVTREDMMGDEEAPLPNPSPAKGRGA
jgi:hypothetical protein